MAFKAARNLFRDFLRLPNKVRSYILQDNVRGAFRFDRNGADYVVDGCQTIVKPGIKTKSDRIGSHQQIRLHRYIRRLSRLILSENRFCHLYAKPWLNQTNRTTLLFGAVGLAYYGSSDASGSSKLSLDDIVMSMTMASQCNLEDFDQSSLQKTPNTLREFKVKERLGEPSSSAAVYAAEYQNKEYAIKIMFNYEHASNESAIRKGFSRECCVLSSSKRSLDAIEKSAQCTLPSHPNIVRILNALVEETPCPSDALQNYPSALPKRINPDGFGRNKTMCIVMPKYDCTLRSYLVNQMPSDQEKMLIAAQLLEGVAHLVENNEAHRDLKTDNVLLETSTRGGAKLVITDFGCCLGDKNLRMKLPFESDHVDRGGNSALMAPEIASVSPSPGGFLNYSKADIWACGAIILEMFGSCNPFSRGFLESRNYNEEDVLLFCKADILIQNMIRALLKRDPIERPTADEAASLPILIQYAPEGWMTDAFHVSETDVNTWLMMMWLRLLRDERLCLSRKLEIPTDVKVRRCFLERARASTILSALVFLNDCEPYC